MTNNLVFFCIQKYSDVAQGLGGIYYVLWVVFYPPDSRTAREVQVQDSCLGLLCSFQV